jgi:DNA-binding transcriptional MerR regulator
MNKEDNLKPFQKGFDKRRNLKGAPRKWISELKDKGYRIAEINDAIQVLLTMSMEELEEVKSNAKATILEKTIANALKKSLDKGTLDSLETLLTRAFGKPKEKVEQDIKISNHTIKLKFGNSESE